MTAVPRGYLIASVSVVDGETYETYRRLVPAVIAQFGGVYLVRGGEADRLEHADELGRVVVIEFASVAAARRFYHSAEYAPLLAIRERSTRSVVAIVAGYEQALAAS